MPIPVVCPTCGQAGHVPDKAAGHRAKCPTCLQDFEVASSTTANISQVKLGSLSSPPPVREPARRQLHSVAAVIRFACPSCKAILESLEDVAGGKVACPRCAQRILVPLPASNKTKLAEPVDVTPDEAISQVRILSSRRKRPDEKHCVECGAIIRARAELCPSCGVRQPYADEGEFPRRPSRDGVRIHPRVVAWSPDHATGADRQVSPKLPALVGLSETFGRGGWHGQETVPQQRSAESLANVLAVHLIRHVLAPGRPEDDHILIWTKPLCWCSGKRSDLPPEATCPSRGCHRASPAFRAPRGPANRGSAPPTG
jgi:DNA-directed RNA polymerase subunit M/transcription elongation factor TFIIS